MEIKIAIEIKGQVLGGLGWSTLANNDKARDGQKWSLMRSEWHNIVVWARVHESGRPERKRPRCVCE